MELVSCCCLSPLLFTELRDGLDVEVSATDASMKRGGLRVTTGLSPLGSAQAERCCTRSSTTPREFLIVSCFDGIGAVRRAWQMLHLEAAGYIAIECCPLARRVVAASWPHIIAVDNIMAINRAVVRSWGHLFPHVRHVLYSGGFP